jgi:undecaprenyl-diphosphatase
MRIPTETLQMLRGLPWRRAFAWRQVVLLVALMVVAGGVGGFVELAEEIGEGSTRSIDTAILLAMRSPSDSSAPVGPFWLEEAAGDLTALGSVAVTAAVTAIVIGYLLIARLRRHALLVLIAVGGGTLWMPLLKGGFDRPRPDLVPHLAEVSTSSFPSGHAMLSAVVYLTLGALLAQSERRRRVGIYIIAVAALLTVTVGCTRVYLGVHWPSDVLAGWFAGASWALFCWLVAEAVELWLSGRRTRRRASP